MRTRHVAALTIVLFACKTAEGTVGAVSAEDGGTATGAGSMTVDSGPDTSGAATTGHVEPKFDLGAPDVDNSGCAPSRTDASLEGVVYGPDGSLPISGALVYTTAAPPEGIPQHVYCDECVDLDCTVPQVLSEADGSFSLASIPGPDQYLVVQKGQFMRVTALDIDPGTTSLAAESTTLPATNDPALGLYMPRIALGFGLFDRLEDTFGKVGLGQTAQDGTSQTLIPGTEPFDIYENGKEPGMDGFASQGSMAALLADPDRMAEYHIIFLPCTATPYWAMLQDPLIQDNIREWVAAGGRWYVTDWSNEFLELPFPEYQSFYPDEVNTDVSIPYDALGEVLDPRLLAWLDALPVAFKDINPVNSGNDHPTLFQTPFVMTIDHFSGIRPDLPEILVDGPDGEEVNVGHSTWIEGVGGNGYEIPENALHPLTLTGQYGCGKIQFSSYHAGEFSAFGYTGLLPQELVLVYTILEIGVCQTPLPVPAG